MDIMQCCVLECKNSSEDAAENVSFHKFPEAGPERDMWLLASGRQGWTPPPDAFMCSDHFQADAFVSGLLVPMKFIHICRICLATNRKMFNIVKETKLAHHYTVITGVRINERSLHQLVCWECRARLASSSTFRENAITANKILNRLNDDPYYLLDVPTVRKNVDLTSQLEAVIYASNHTDHSFRYTYDTKKTIETNASKIINRNYSPVQQNIDTKSIHIPSTSKITDNDLSSPNEVLSKPGQRNVGIKTKAPAKTLKETLKHNPKRRKTRVVSIDSSDSFDVGRNEKSNLDARRNQEKEEIFKDPIGQTVINIKVERDVLKDESPDDTQNVMSNDMTVHFELKSEGIEADPVAIHNADHQFANQEEIEIEFASDDDFGKIEVKLLDNVPMKEECKSAKRGIKKELAIKESKVKKKTLSNKKKDIGEDVKRVVKCKRNPGKSKRKVSRDNNSRQFVKLSEKIFSIKELSLEEQMAEIEKRKESSNYIISPHKCHICFKGYRDNGAYKLHMNRHTEQAGPYECKICKIRFKKRIYDHARKHSLRFICKQCPYVSIDKGAAILHEKYHEGKKYQCPHCPEVYDKMTSYLSHLRIAHPTEHICQLCGFSFINSNGLVRHKIIKHRFDDQQVPPDGPTCDFCNIQFLNKQAIVTHMKESCKNDVFRRKFQRRSTKATTDKSNQRIVEPQAGPINCEQCDEQLPNFRSYFNHFRRVHPDKNRTVFPIGPATCMCEICGRIMQNSKLLEDHMGLHTDVKQFKCNVCEKSFHKQYALITHQKLHSEEPRKTFRCDICDKEFSFYGNMVRHKFLHTGLKPYECEICNKTFNSKQGKQLHVQYVHMKKPWPKRERGSRQRKNKQEIQYSE